jgi:type 1 glutamine amidotransferase
MVKLWFTASALTCALIASPAAAKQLLDCPLRDAPFSAQSPVIDILLSDAAKAVIDKHMPGVIAGMPPFFASTKAPSFASILTFEKMSGMMSGGKAVDLKALDADLRALPVTATDKVKRCERYDDERPVFKLAKGKPRVLLFEKMTGFRDTPSVLAANAAITAMAQRKGWALAVTDKGGAMHPSVLKQVDVVIWNNVSGDVLTLTQRKAFRSYIEKGGGFVGVHGSAGDPVYFWDWYPDTLIGARFIGHPSDPQFQDARVVIESSASGVGSNLAPGWTMNDEWYSFAKSARLNGANVVATLDESSYTPGASRFGGPPLTMGADHPIAWTRCIGKGRSFYSAIGHRPETYSDGNHVKLLEQAVAWAADRKGSKCAAGK